MFGWDYFTFFIPYAAVAVLTLLFYRRFLALKLPLRPSIVAALIGMFVPGVASYIWFYGFAEPGLVSSDAIVTAFVVFFCAPLILTLLVFIPGSRILLKTKQKAMLTTWEKNVYLVLLAIILPIIFFILARDMTFATMASHPSPNMVGVFVAFIIAHIVLSAGLVWLANKFALRRRHVFGLVALAFAIASLLERWGEFVMFQNDSTLFWGSLVVAFWFFIAAFSIFCAVALIWGVIANSEMPLGRDWFLLLPLAAVVIAAIVVFWGSYDAIPYWGVENPTYTVGMRPVMSEDHEQPTILWSSTDSCELCNRICYEHMQDEGLSGCDTVICERTGRYHECTYPLSEQQQAAHASLRFTVENEKTSGESFNIELNP